MKTIILFLSLVLSASSATLYPVLTDNSGRTFTGGATNLALLSGTNVFSGTNTFNTNTILGTAKLQDTLDAKASAANLVTVSNAQVTTDGKLEGYVTNLGGLATNLSAVGLTVTGQTNTDLTASRLMVTDANKKLTSSTATTAEAGYLSGVTSAIQTQLDAKPNVALTNVALLSGTNVFSGTNTLNTNTILGTAKLQDTLDSKPTVALTNVARLDQSQTWTGTPTFPAAVFSANNVTFRTLYSAPTNLFFATINTNATSATYTNAGDFQNCTSLLKVSMPPLLGSNSMVFVSYGSETTNANTSTCVLTAYAGSATNFIGDAAAFRLTSAGSTYSSQNGPGLFVFANQASFTNQIGNRASFTTKVPAEHLFGRTSFCDTSTNWTLYLGLTTTGNHTNLHITTLSVIELVKN